ncbi:hypothetical protein MM300_22065 [Evansella sp. LMS18]|uniref:hypothetical protein n=1 Tax=Evansella sp. LMS18 TaxID=2924033 RepID=UPI0020D1900B|nr:hypothetical protein [Evansella sp. LMS18]UTR10520.1 hypothetical protein MM300_22065 [Evansella sp. LMS18]
MDIYKGAEFDISEDNKLHYKKGDTLKISQKKGSFVQFTLGDGRSYGTMPLQQLEYLLKKRELIEKSEYSAEDTSGDERSGVIGQL